MVDVTQFTNQLPISAGQTQIPYQEFTYTIAAGANVDIFQVFNYFRVLSLSAGSLSVQFGQNGLITPYSGQGVGIQLAFTYDRLRLINTSGVSMTITIAIALGIVFDDRLNVSSALSVGSVIPGTGATNQGKAEDDVANSGDVGIASLAVRRDGHSSTTLQSASGDYSNFTTDATGQLYTKAASRFIVTSQISIGSAAVAINSFDALNGEVAVSAGTTDLYIGTAAVTTGNGFLIPAGATFSLNGHMGELYGIRVGGSVTAYVIKGYT